jgi:excisionase family DNA binding protein
MKPIAVSVKETRRLLGLGHTTVSAMVRDGRLESTLVGRRRLILLESVLKIAGAWCPADG